MPDQLPEVLVAPGRAPPNGPVVDGVTSGADDQPESLLLGMKPRLGGPSVLGLSRRWCGWVFRRGGPRELRLAWYGCRVRGRLLRRVSSTTNLVGGTLPRFGRSRAAGTAPTPSHRLISSRQSLSGTRQSATLRGPPGVRPLGRSTQVSVVDRDQSTSIMRSLPGFSRGILLLTGVHGTTLGGSRGSAGEERGIPPIVMRTIPPTMSLSCGAAHTTSSKGSRYCRKSDDLGLDRPDNLVILSNAS